MCRRTVLFTPHTTLRTITWQLPLVARVIEDGETTDPLLSSGTFPSTTCRRVEGLRFPVRSWLYWHLVGPDLKLSCEAPYWVSFCVRRVPLSCLLPCLRFGQKFDVYRVELQWHRGFAKASQWVCSFIESTPAWPGTYMKMIPEHIHSLRSMWHPSSSCHSWSWSGLPWSLWHWWCCCN